VHIHQREMRLAVLAQTIAQRLEAPIFAIGDGAAQLLDDALEVGRQFVDLLRRHVLTRKIYVFVKRHDLPFLVCQPHPAPSHPSLRKGSTLEMREHGTLGGKALPRVARPSVQLPAGSGGSRLIAISGRNTRRWPVSWGAGPAAGA